jgi:glycosyltransferase involved in cell wall biosynthesis
VIHAEDGFGSDEAERLKSRRVWSRRLFLNRISGLVVPSRTLADIARTQFRIRPQLVRWIPNGIDTQRFAPARNESLRHAWGVGPDEVLFGFVGRLGEEKNLDSAIRAVARTPAPGVRFVVIGDGPCRAALQSLSEELGLGTRVIFAGVSPDTAPVYGAFDAFLLSSRTEQMPMSLLEAMACGLPAVCTDVGDCGEMLGTRELPHLVPRRNVEALASALSALAADPQLRANAGARNRKRVETQYSLSGMLAAYERIYETGSVSAA